MQLAVYIARGARQTTSGRAKDQKLTHERSETKLILGKRQRCGNAKFKAYTNVRRTIWKNLPRTKKKPKT
jgi:hypothetical protein